jgi:hypothetical protein
MDFSVYQNKLPMSGQEVMQRFGYARIVSHHTGHESFVKRLYREHYPRFHCYVKEDNGKVSFSLHLDQKEASYKGNRMHSGEYDGPLVEQEILSLKQFIVSLVSQTSALS